MMQKIKFRPKVLVLAALLLPLVPFGDASAQAQLFVHPTLIMFSGDHRNDVVYVVNQGSATGVFELEWRDFAMTPNGGLSPAEGDAPWSLQPFVRFSPRRVTLQPGETQVVRVALRPNDAAAEREYYSHLRVVTMEDDLHAATLGSQAADKAVTVSARTAIAVPVIWRNSSAAPQAIIESATFDPERKAIVVELRRSGTVSTRGYLHILDSDDGDDGNVLRALADPVPVVIYPSSEQRTVTVPLNEGQRLKAGAEVIYSSDIELTNRSTRHASYVVRR